jgi:ABC-2 type transport system permease protein
MWWISLFTTLLFTWTSLALGLGFGASFADFKAENRAAAMGPGAILFLFSAVFYELAILALGMRPTYRVVRGALRNETIATPDLVLFLLWAAGAVLVSLLIAAVALRSGLKKLRP